MIRENPSATPCIFALITDLSLLPTLQDFFVNSAALIYFNNLLNICNKFLLSKATLMSNFQIYSKTCLQM